MCVCVCVCVHSTTALTRCCTHISLARILGQTHFVHLAAVPPCIAVHAPGARVPRVADCRAVSSVPVCVCARARVCARVRACARACTCTCTCVCVCVCVCARARVCVGGWVAGWVGAWVYVRTHVRACVHVPLLSRRAHPPALPPPAASLARNATWSTCKTSRNASSDMSSSATARSCCKSSRHPFSSSADRAPGSRRRGTQRLCPWRA